MLCLFFFFFKQKTAYEMRISDWSSDVCSSDLVDAERRAGHFIGAQPATAEADIIEQHVVAAQNVAPGVGATEMEIAVGQAIEHRVRLDPLVRHVHIPFAPLAQAGRAEERQSVV